MSEAQTSREEGGGGGEEEEEEDEDEEELEEVEEEDLEEIMEDESEVNETEELLQELRESLNQDLSGQQVSSSPTYGSFTSDPQASSRLVKRMAVFSFPTPARTFRISYTEQKSLLAKAVLKHRWFARGQLLQTHEKGVLYPITHIYEVPQTEKIKFLDPLALGEDIILYQSLYEEIGRMDIPVIAVSQCSTSSPLFECSRQAFLVVGFKTLDQTFNHLLEESWKDLSGARSIYLHLSTDYGLSDLQFYRRIHPNDFSTFAYILLVKLNNVTRKNHVFLLDFVHRLRLRMLGYLALYGHVVENTAVVKMKHTVSLSSTESECCSDDYASGSSNNNRSSSPS